MHRGHDPLGIATGIKHVAKACFGITEYRAVTLQRAYRKGFAYKVHGWFYIMLLVIVGGPLGPMVSWHESRASALPLDQISNPGNAFRDVFFIVVCKTQPDEVAGNACRF
jgi:hypothetical protein